MEIIGKKNKKYSLKVFLKKHWFIILISLFILSRLIILFNSSKFYHPEECIYGAIAKDIIEGPHLDIMEYQYDDYGGAFILTGLFMIPFFKIFGMTIYSLRFLPLFYSTILFILSGVFLKDLFNKKIAIIGMIFLIFSPPYYTLMGLTIFAGYLETSIFLIISLYILLNLVIGKKDLKGPFLLGVIIGLATWIYYYGLVILVSTLFLWFISEPKFFKEKRFFVFIIAFFIGFSPWFLYATKYNFSSLDKAASVSIFDLGMVSYKLKQLFYYSPAALYFRGIFGLDRLISQLFLSITILSFLSLSVRCSIIFLSDIFRNKKNILKISSEKVKKNPEITLLVSVISYFFIFIFSNLNLDYINFNDLWSINNPVSFAHIYFFFLPLILINAIFVYKLIKNKNKFINKIGIILFILFLMMGILGNAFLIDKKGINNSPICYALLGRSIGWKYYNEEDTQNIMKKCFAVNNTQYIIGCFTGIGEKTLMYQDNFTKAMQVCDRLPRKYQPFCYEGIGNDIGVKYPSKINSLCMKPNYELNKIFCFIGSKLEKEMALLGDPHYEKKLKEFCYEYINKDYIKYCLDLKYYDIVCQEFEDIPYLCEQI